MRLLDQGIDHRFGEVPKRVTVRTSSSNDLCRLEVEDSGVGIEESDRLRVFEPFYTTKPADKGTGLGLSISYAIVKNHGGDIECVDSEEGGTGFRVSLPAAEQEPRVQ